MMFPEIKALWTKALRSGLYRKATGFLRTNADTYCCLGVLCEEYRKATGVGKWVLQEGLGEDDVTVERYYTFVTVPNDEDWGASSVLPNQVRLWAGLQSNNPVVGDFTLVHANDGGISTVPVRQHEFPEIADLIDEHL